MQNEETNCHDLCDWKRRGHSALFLLPSTFFMRMGTVIGRVTLSQAVPALEGGRSVKDILSHLAVWERRCARWLDISLRGEVPERPEPGVTWEQMDDLNERDFLRAETLEEARDDYRRSFLQLFDIVNAMPEEDFGEVHRFSWWEGQPISQVIAANSFEHYREHAEQIRIWLQGFEKS